MSARVMLMATELSVEAVNAASRPSPLAVRRAARRTLAPVEVALATRYRRELSGNVLEIASRGDGLTVALAHHAAAFTGIGLSRSEVDHCRARHPRAAFVERDLVDLGDLPDASFDAVVIGRCALDQLGDAHRRRLLAQLARVLTDEGVLLFSSHNLACESLVRRPWERALARPWTLWRLPRAMRNRAALGRLQQRSYGYAILNDASAGYGRLNYYVSREHQARQLADVGLELIECVDRHDDAVAPGQHAYGQHRLYYAAARAGD